MENHAVKAPELPNEFIWRRLHSLTGFWLILFLIEHLLANSQAALFIGENGSGFVRMVNSIQNLPYLPVIEIVLLGIPFLIHGMYGIYVLKTGKINSFSSNGSSPYLDYGRNKAYTWQRWTAWLLLFGILAHVIHMRFVEYPDSAPKGSHIDYFVQLNQDDGLFTLAPRLDFTLYDQQKIDATRQDILNPKVEELETKAVIERLTTSLKNYFKNTKEENERLRQTEEALRKQEIAMNLNWLATLEKHPINEHQVIAVTQSFGTAELLIVRDSFKNPLTIGLYTLLVLATCYHAFNGLWTFAIKWGITLTQRSQKIMLTFSTILMVLVAFLGLVSIWGTYWLNLKQ